MFEQTTHTVFDTAGEPLELVVQHVDIDPKMAREIFERGTPTGTWGWKHQIWTVATLLELAEVQAAARFFYGWANGSEKTTALPGGRFRFEAYYAC